MPQALAGKPAQTLLIVREGLLTLSTVSWPYQSFTVNTCAKWLTYKSRKQTGCRRKR